MKEIFWITNQPGAALAIVLRPRGGDWLKDELLRMQGGGIQTLVSMLESEEEDSLGLAEEREMAIAIGLDFLSYPIPDRQMPEDVNAFREFANDLAIRLRAGERVGVHCRGCIGRASIATACALIHLGGNPSATLEAIRNARGCEVPDTAEQKQWILDYRAKS